jgi:hypothetical protein
MESLSQHPDRTKSHVNSFERLRSIETLGSANKIIMADGTIEKVDKNALGDELDQMPSGYYWSPQFLGSLAVSQTTRSLTARVTDYLTGAIFSEYLCLSRLGTPFKHSVSP